MRLACAQGSRKLEGREQKGKAGSTWLHKAKSVVGGALGGRSSVRYIFCLKMMRGRSAAVACRSTESE